MKKKLIFSLVLALLLALAIEPFALAAGIPELAELEPGPEGSLRNYVDDKTESVNIRGTEIPIENVFFLDFLAVNEEVSVCIGEVPENTAIMPLDNELPEGMRTEIRKESVREHEQAVAERNAEHILREEDLEETRRIALEDDGDLDRDGFYLYLEGTPAKTGSYLIFLSANDELFLCSQDILETLPGRKPEGESQEPAEVPAQQPVPEQQPESEQVPEPVQEPETEPEPEGWANAPEEWNDLPPIEAVAPAEEPAALSAPSFSETQTFNQSTQPAQDVPDYGASGNQTHFFFSDTPAATNPVVNPPVVTETPVSPLSVSIVGMTECRPGDQVVLSAYVNGNSGWTGYQWYYSMGPYSAPIDGATDSRILADTSQAGVWNYFCLVTDQLGRQAISDPLTLTVVERQVRSVSIESNPIKLDYYDGQTIDTTGLRLLVRYDDGSVGHISEGFTVTPNVVTYTGAGTQNVNVFYNGASVAYQIRVSSAWDLISNIAVLNLPNKTAYTVGESLDTTGLVLRIYSTDGNYVDMDHGFECSPTYFSRAGGQVITVTFGNKTCTFSVSVQEENRILGISLQSLPANRSYTVGDTISTAGLSLQVRTTRGYETVTSGFTYTPRVATAAGTQTITVLYGGQSATFTVDVSAAVAPTPTPRASALPTYSPLPGAVTPSPTPAAGAQPTVSATPRPTTAPARRNTGVGAMVKILFVVALLALAGLIFIVLYLRRQDKAEDTRAQSEPPRRRRH